MGPVPFHRREQDLLYVAVDFCQNGFEQAKAVPLYDALKLLQISEISPSHQIWCSRATISDRGTHFVMTVCKGLQRIARIVKTLQLLSVIQDYVTHGSGYHQKDRKPSQNDKTEHGMEKTVQNQGQSPKMPIKLPIPLPTCKTLNPENPMNGEMKRRPNGGLGLSVRPSTLTASTSQQKEKAGGRVGSRYLIRFPVILVPPLSLLLREVTSFWKKSKLVLLANQFPIDDADFDLKEDLLTLKRLLNSDPSSTLPPEEQKFEELKTVEPSSDELPEIELKDLPAQSLS
ncbi:hypothetical protein Tco_0445501 [Tanacetum coccineum]